MFARRKEGQTTCWPRGEDPTSWGTLLIAVRNKEQGMRRRRITEKSEQGLAS